MNIWGDEITIIDLPKLEEVHGEVIVYPVAKLLSLNLESLAYVDGFLNVNGAPLLETLNLSSLVEVGAFISISNTNLSTIDLDSLETIGTSPLLPGWPILSIFGNDQLMDFSFESLTLTDATFRISDNPSLCQTRVDEFIDALTADGCECALVGTDVHGPNGEC